MEAELELSSQYELILKLIGFQTWTGCQLVSKNIIEKKCAKIIN